MIGVAGRSNWDAKYKNVINRLAASAATVQYGVYAVDIRRINANSTDEDTAADNVVAVDATNVLGARFVIAQETAAAGVRFKTQYMGFGSVRCSGAVAIGDWLAPVSAQNHLVAIGAGSANVGLCLAQATTANTSGTGIIGCDFFGGIPQRS